MHLNADSYKLFAHDVNHGTIHVDTNQQTPVWPPIFPPVPPRPVENIPLILYNADVAKEQTHVASPAEMNQKWRQGLKRPPGRAHYPLPAPGHHSSVSTANTYDHHHPIAPSRIPGPSRLPYDSDQHAHDRSRTKKEPVGKDRTQLHSSPVPGRRLTRPKSSEDYRQEYHRGPNANPSHHPIPAPAHHNSVSTPITHDHHSSAAAQHHVQNSRPAHHPEHPLPAPGHHNSGSTRSGHPIPGHPIPPKKSALMKVGAALKFTKGKKG